VGRPKASNRATNRRSKCVVGTLGRGHPFDGPLPKRSGV
jgi:hypothetical protein